MGYVEANTMSDNKIVYFKVSEDYQLPFEMAELSQTEQEFIISSGWNNLCFNKAQIEKLALVQKAGLEMAARIEKLEAENKKFRSVFVTIDSMAKTMPVIDVKNDDKAIREFMRRHGIFNCRKKEDNIERINDWAEKHDYKINLI